MMTVPDEIHHEYKYYHIVVVEFYEWIARVAIKYSELMYQLHSSAEENITDINKDD